jgi:hypothetical protein
MSDPSPALFAQNLQDRRVRVGPKAKSPIFRSGFLQNIPNARLTKGAEAMKPGDMPGSFRTFSLNPVSSIPRMAAWSLGEHKYRDPSATPQDDGYVERVG